MNARKWQVKELVNKWQGKIGVKQLQQKYRWDCLKARKITMRIDVQEQQRMLKLRARERLKDKKGEINQLIRRRKKENKWMEENKEEQSD